jgi:hypothetical protein
MSKLIVVVFLRDGFFVFLAHPLLAAYFCSRSCVEVLLLPSFLSLAACHKTQTLTILSHSPSDKQGQDETHLQPKWH